MEQQPTGVSEPYWRSEEAFKDAVAQAAEGAVRAVEKTRPVWMLFVAALAGFVVACSVSIPVTIVLNNESHEAQSHNTLVNCELITQVASSIEGNFLEGIKSKEQFISQSTDRLGLTQKQFNELVEKGEASQKKELDAIKKVARTNCQMRIN